MKNKGFTLIELLAVIIILSVLSVIVIPTVSDSIKQAKNDAYNEQVKIIENQAEKYFLDSNFDVLENERKVIYLEEILNTDYINKSKIINPKTDEEMTGCVLVTSYSKQYHFKYIENIGDCIKYTDIKE